VNEIDICPICSAGVAECEHEIVRWSLYAAEFEPSALLSDVLTLNEALIRFLRHCRRMGRVPTSRELKQLYNLGVVEGWIDSEDVIEDSALPDAGVNAVLGVIGALPGVHDLSEGVPPQQQTRVLWARDASAIRERIQEWVREMEIEVDRREE
jgi:hypothetical protein